MSDKEITRESLYYKSDNRCLPHRDSSLTTKIYFWVQNLLHAWISVIVLLIFKSKIISQSMHLGKIR